MSPLALTTTALVPLTDGRHFGFIFSRPVILDDANFDPDLFHVASPAERHTITQGFPFAVLHPTHELELCEWPYTASAIEFANI